MRKHWLLFALLVLGTVVPTFTELSTCRCCLFTVNELCRDLALTTRRGSSRPRGPSDAARYHSSDHGIFAAGTYDRSGAGLRGHEYEEVGAERVRLGWPVRWLTLDRVTPGPEWHLVAEWWTLPVNLMTALAAYAGARLARRWIAPAPGSSP